MIPVSLILPFALGISGVDTHFFLLLPVERETFLQSKRLATLGLNNTLCTFSFGVDLTNFDGLALLSFVLLGGRSHLLPHFYIYNPFLTVTVCEL